MSDMSASARVRVVSLQPDIALDRVTANRDAIRRTMDALVRETPADLVVLPEVFDGNPNDTDGAAARRFLSTLARSCDVHVIGGSCLITEPSGRRSNRCYVVHRGGNEIGWYDKRVLFSSEVGVRAPGASAGVFQLDGIRVGVLICADLWHPELARALCGRVDLLAVPARTGVPSESYQPYARANWRAMALTRAMENGFAVVVADWSARRHERARAANAPTTPQDHFTSGVTSIVDPSHRPDIDRIQRVLHAGLPGEITAEIDLSALTRYRAYRESVGLLPRGPRPPGPI